jgi:hypothetical protein
MLYSSTPDGVRIATIENHRHSAGDVFILRKKNEKLRDGLRGDNNIIVDEQYVLTFCVIQAEIPAIRDQTLLVKPE